MVTGRNAAMLILVGIIFLSTACGTAQDKIVSVNLDLPVDWESVIDMDALGAPSSTPYIGTIRFLYGGAQVQYQDFPYAGHSASFNVGEVDYLTVQALTAGQVIMEGSVSGVGPVSGDVTISLEKANGFSEAGTLLYPRQNHSAVLANGVVYILGGNPNTGVIEAVASSTGNFVAGAYAASLVYPRDETTVLHDAAGNQLFVFKGASAVDDNLYEVVDLGNEIVVPRIIAKSRYNYYPVWNNPEILLVGGDDGVSTWFENALVIDAQNLNEQVWTGIGSSLIRDNPECLNDGIRLSCFGGGTEIIEVFNLLLGGIDHSLSILPNMDGFTATLLENGDIIIIGGFEGLTTYNQVKVFQPNSGDYLDLGSGIRHPRYFHTATLIGNDKLLIIGGGPTVEASHSAELLDLTTGLSTLLPWPMKVSRVGHTATLLPDGRVLVAGGNATDRRMEVFNPRSGL